MSMLTTEQLDEQLTIDSASAVDWSDEMSPEDFQKLTEDLDSELARGARSLGILGLTKVTLQITAWLTSTSSRRLSCAIYSDVGERGNALSAVPIRPLGALANSEIDVLVVASDADKERLLEAALPFIRGTPKVIVAGYGHLRFRDPILDEELARLPLPSLANGYPHTLAHIHQCLSNAARLGLHGVVAEFGIFKGGTTLLMSRLIERLGMDWRVIGFDTFDGFPPRRSILDMYDHPGCVFTDLAAVKQYLSGRNVEIVSGDIVETCHRLDSEDLVLTFVDTDNYSPAKAAIDVVRERTLIGGAIVFDHFTGVDRFRYTLGERIAGKALLQDARYFQLHGTGVFYRQR